MAELLLLREAAVLIASAVGAYTDLRTGYINDWTTMPLIAFGILANIYELQWLGIGLGIAVFALGYILYYTGKVGGGDVKLYAGIALALPFYDGAVFIVPAALLAALAAVVFFSVYYISKYLRRGIDLKYNSEGIRRACILAAVAAVYFWAILRTGFVSEQYVATLGIPIVFGIAFMALERGIRKEFFVKEIAVSEMEEDEILALDFMEPSERKKIESKMKWVFSAGDGKTLEKSGIHKIMVYRNLPRFGPFIFIGIVAALAVPGFSKILTGGF